MNNTLGGIIVGVVGLVAIVAGVYQIIGGGSEMSGGGMPTVAEVEQIADDAMNNLTTFTSDKRGISLKYPKDWETEEPADGLIFFKFQVMSGLVNVSVASEVPATGDALADYVQLNVDQITAMLTEQMKSSSPIDRTEVEIGGKPATQLRYSFVQRDPEVAIKITQTYVMHAGHAYIITFTTPRELHGACRELFDAIQASVAFQ